MSPLVSITISCFIKKNRNDHSDFFEIVELSIVSDSFGSIESSFCVVAGVVVPTI